jgi:hypothetical protein
MWEREEGLPSRMNGYDRVLLFMQAMCYFSQERPLIKKAKKTILDIKCLFMKQKQLLRLLSHMHKYVPWQVNRLPFIWQVIKLKITCRKIEKLAAVGRILQLHRCHKYSRREAV